MRDIHEYRNGNMFLMIEAEPENDRYFWQFQEGARKRTPVASGFADKAQIDSMVERFTAPPVQQRNEGE